MQIKSHFNYPVIGPGVGPPVVSAVENHQQGMEGDKERFLCFLDEALKIQVEVCKFDFIGPGKFIKKKLNYSVMIRAMFGQTVIFFSSSVK